MNYEIVPNSAPFSVEQRAWLNGFLAGVLGVLDQQKAQEGSSAGQVAAADLLSPLLGAGTSAALTETELEIFPWHDSGLPIEERMQLAEGKPKERRLMAAMAQLNCGTCGYLCKTYGEAIANGSEKNLTLCTPGGTATAKLLRTIAKESNGNGAAKKNGNPGAASSAATDLQREPQQAIAGTRDNPAVAKLIGCDRLNGVESVKDTRHVAIDLSGTNISYRVGDALGVYAANCSSLIHEIVSAAKLDPNANVKVKGTELRIRQALEQLCLRSITQELVDASIESVRIRPKHNGAVAIDGQLVADLEAFMDDDDFCQWDVLEFLQRFGSIDYSPQAFVDSLSPLRPRLYSIASSQSRFPQQVHLTVGRVEDEIRSRKRKGVASTMFADRLEIGADVRVFVHPSHGFTVPSNPKAPMIMVGPGTGIAPFMAFLQQREADKATGKNWLFFGDQKQACDFLYRDQLSVWKENGLLTHLDLAFSRDGSDKVYVQHKMLQQGKEIYDWIMLGGHFYVCGDASRMAADVDQALRTIVSQHGKLNDAQTKSFVQELAKTNRYVRDVY